MLFLAAGCEEIIWAVQVLNIKQPLVPVLPTSNLSLLCPVPSILMPQQVLFFFLTQDLLVSRVL
jgi:hypothetical protein